MSEIKDGGPAFPVPEVVTDGKCYPVDHAGMTLRDYFACQALAGTLPGAKLDPDKYAVLAYRMADAMLKARGQP